MPLGTGMQAGTYGAGGGYRGNAGAVKTRTFGVDKGTMANLYGLSAPMTNYDNTTDTGQLSAGDQKEIASMPWNFRQNVFNKTFPLLQGILGDGSGKLETSKVGGENTPQPQLPNNYVFTPGQTQQQVNAARAQIDQGTQTQKNSIASTMNGRGFGPRSPIAMALGLSADTGGRQQGTDAEREIRMDSAKLNANQDLNVGQLAQQAWSNYNQADIERRKNQVESALSAQRNMASLISALSGFGG